MHAGSFVLFYTINDSDKVEDLKKKKWYEINVHDEININIFCFDINCSR